MLAERLELLGRPRLTLRLTCEVPRGQVIARICDVAPDGSSALVTRGVLNLAARHGRDTVSEWEPGTTEDITFDLNGIGHAFAAGHRIRIALSSAYWPWIWPQPGSEAGWSVEPAAGGIELPVRTGDGAHSPHGPHGPHAPIVFDEPEQAEPLGIEYPEAPDRRPERVVVRDVAAGVWKLDVDPRYGGTRSYPDGLEVTEDARETYTIQETDPRSARTHSAWSIRLHRPGPGWDTRVAVRSEITTDGADFITDNELVCHDGEDEFFRHHWQLRIPRTAG